MKYRCLKKHHKDFLNYGHRGIAICRAWMISDNFFSWALSHGYREGLQVERVDNNGPYSPSNCIFTTRKEQMRNRRDTVYLTFRGERRSLAAWAEILDINRITLGWRIRQGWSVEKALTQPIQGAKPGGLKIIGDD